MASVAASPHMPWQRVHLGNAALDLISLTAIERIAHAAHIKANQGRQQEHPAQHSSGAVALCSGPPPFLSAAQHVIIIDRIGQCPARSTAQKPIN